MTRIRVALLCVVVAAVFAITVQAQGPFAPGSGTNLNERVAALEARLAKLEGNIDATDLVGTYSGAGLITDLDGGPPASATMIAVSGMMTLAEGGSGTLRQAGDAISLEQGFPWTDHVFSFPSEEIDITWSYDSTAGTVHVSDGTSNLDVDFNVGAGGRVLTLGELSDDNTVDLFVLTRLR